MPQPPQSVTVVSGGTSIVTFSNLLQRGNLVVTKTSEDGLVEGHEFRLYGTSTTVQQVDMYAVSDSSGKATFKDVPVGTYTLSEENTAVRYVIPEDQTVTVTWKETAEAVVDNTLKKWRADIYKLDAEHADRNDHSAMPKLMAADDYEYKSAKDLGYPYHTFLCIEPMRLFAERMEIPNVEWILLGGYGKLKRSWIESVMERKGNIPVFMIGSKLFKDVWRAPLIQEYPPLLYRPAEKTLPHCSECKYCYSVRQGKRGLWRACRHYKIVRQDKDSGGRHIPGRYAAVSPQWCPKRPETNWRFTKRV